MHEIFLEYSVRYKPKTSADWGFLERVKAEAFLNAGMSGVKITKKCITVSRSEVALARELFKARGLDISP